MKIAFLAGACVALATSTFALVQPQRERNSFPRCISRQEANIFVQRFESILAKQNSSLGTPEQTANALLADNFTEISNSILQLEGLPLNGDGLSAHSKQEWVTGVVKYAPPYGEITNKQIVVDCDTIVWYYRFGKIGSGEYPIQGFDLFHMTPTGTYKSGGSCAWQVAQLYVEFDNISWGKDANEIVCNSTASGPPSKRNRLS